MKIVVEYHSQIEVQNDKWIVEIALPSKYGGFFVEAGAFDGMEMSNTYVLEKEFQWTGICIEPEPKLFEKLIKNRQCICENIGLSDVSGDVDFLGSPNGLGGIKTSIRHKNATKSFPTIRRPCETLYQVLVRHAVPEIIDYLSLDTEGSEYDILKNFPFDKFSFRCITIESEDCEALLLSKGYLSVKNPFNPFNTWERYYRHPLL